MDDQRRCDATEGAYVGPPADSVFADLIHGHIVRISNSGLIEVPRGFDDDVGLSLNETNWNRVRHQVRVREMRSAKLERGGVTRVRVGVTSKSPTPTLRRLRDSLTNQFCICKITVAFPMCVGLARLVRTESPLAKRRRSPHSVHDYLQFINSRL